MINKFVDIRIKQTAANAFDIHVSGNHADVLKAIALAANEVVQEAPEDEQEYVRVLFLKYLNAATRGN